MTQQTRPPREDGEKMDLYDDLRRPAGRTILRGSPVPEGRYITVVHICIFNAAGEMLIQRRQSTKRAFPDLWDVSVGGGVQAGENSREAAAREVFEELGLALDFSGVRPYLTVNFSDGFDDVYLVQRELDPAALHLQASEVSAVRWAPLEEIQALNAAGKFVPYDTGFLQYLFEMRTRMGFFKNC